MFGFFESRRERDRKFDELFWEKQRLVESIVRRYARNEDLVDDLMQEVFLKVYLNLPAVLKAASRDGYLRRLAVNVIADYFRKHRDKAHEVTLSPELAEVLPADGGQHEETISAAQRSETFLGMVQALPEKRRQVIMLRVVDELPFREIGEILGISEVSARNLFSIGMRQLKEQAARRREVRYA